MKLYSHQHTSSQNRKSLLAGRSFTKGFTLVELLVVLAIIAVLASISFGYISTYLEKGKRTESHLLATKVVKACEDFKVEYGFYPKPTTPEADVYFPLDNTQLEFLLSLTGEDDTQNINETRFLAAPKAKNNFSNGMKVDGSDKPVELVDSWGNSIYVAIDYDFKTEGMKLNGVKERIQRSVVAVSAGPDGVIGNEDDVRTWEKP